MTDIATAYPVHIVVPVAWGEMDSLGHVNNIVYFRYFESARIAYFDRVKIVFAAIGPILAHTSCDFLLPLEYPDTLRLEAGVSRLGNSSFTMAYRIHSRKHENWVARGQGVCVWYDYESKTSAPLPGDVRERIHLLEHAAIAQA